ncbi:MAG: hypothetical protein HYW02_04150 [Deltaproteobacteria bacterium]|nr:hypothetical protein [Deltaproteobacteria bacterium]
MTSAIEQDVPLDGHIWEIKDYRQWNAGSTEQVKNQALKYQRAINQGLFQGATIEVLGNVDPKFIQFLQEYAPDVELLYTLELPDGHEVSVVLKRASNGHSLASSKISERLTIRERRIADGLQAAVDRGDLSLLANDIIESVDLEGSSFKDELMKAYDPAVKRIDPTRIESLEAFREYDRLVHEKRWRIFGKAEPVAPVTKQTPGPVRTRQPFGVLYGGFTTAGQGVIIPHDGTVVKNEAGLEIRFNEQERCYEYRREGEDHWREISVAETIILSNPGDRLVQPRVYTLVTMEGLIDGDPYQQFDDLRTQAESQLHKNGIDPYLRKLGDRGSPIDRHNLEMLFSEAARKAEAVYYQTAEGREIGMGMGHVRLFASIDRNGQITDFVQDAPEIDRLSKEGISQPPRPDGTTVVEIRLDNMTGQVLVNDRGLIVPSLTPAALARYNNLHRFVARVGPTFNGRTLQYLMSLPR